MRNKKDVRKVERDNLDADGGKEKNYSAGDLVIWPRAGDSYSVRWSHLKGDSPLLTQAANDMWTVLD
jgi:hypothetical protein